MGKKNIATLLGGVALGVLLGASGMYAHITHQRERADTRAGLPQRQPQAASTAALADPLNTTWQPQARTDPITGVVSWFMGGMSREASTILYVNCGPVDSVGTIWVYGDGLYPGQDVRDIDARDSYQVAYRFDDKPGVTNELWKGGVRVANAAHPTVFLDGLQHSRMLVMQIGSLDMDVSSRAAQYQHFDLVGFGAAFAQLQAHCSAASQTVSAK